MAEAVPAPPIVPPPPPVPPPPEPLPSTRPPLPREEALLLNEVVPADSEVDLILDAADLAEVSGDDRTAVEAIPLAGLQRLLQSFVEEANLHWLLYLGIFLIVTSSVFLVASQWPAIPHLLQYLILLAYTSGFYGASWQMLGRFGLRRTGHALIVVTTLLIPLNFWGMQALGLFHDGAGWAFALLAAAWLSLMTYRCASHVHRSVGRRFTLAFVPLAMAQAVMGLWTPSWSSMAVSFLVMAMVWGWTRSEEPAFDDAADRRATWIYMLGGVALFLLQILCLIEVTGWAWLDVTPYSSPRTAQVSCPSWLRWPLLLAPFVQALWIYTVPRLAMPVASFGALIGLYGLAFLVRMPPGLFVFMTIGFAALALWGTRLWEMAPPARVAGLGLPEGRDWRRISTEWWYPLVPQPSHSGRLLAALPPCVPFRFGGNDCGPGGADGRDLPAVRLSLGRGQLAVRGPDRKGRPCDGREPATARISPGLERARHFPPPGSRPCRPGLRGRHALHDGLATTGHRPGAPGVGGLCGPVGAGRGLRLPG